VRFAFLQKAEFGAPGFASVRAWRKEVVS